jgi:hypothetical protein
VTRRNRQASFLSPVLVAVAIATSANGCAAVAAPHDYRWLPANAPINALAERIAPPPGFVREPVEAGSWAHWLRGLPLRPPEAAVKLYTGAPKVNQSAHVAVVDIDVGRRDLQQCADAIMRLRAEWLYAGDHFIDIGFNYTNGVRVPFSRWMHGERPKPQGARVIWARTGTPGSTYASFRAYMDQIFSYAGTASLERELKPVAVEDVRIGDVFIKGGFPGHAVLVVDVAVHPTTRERRFLLLQSYMPAQDMHILKNPHADDGSAWYRTDFGAELVTPEWTFPRTALRRWP